MGSKGKAEMDFAAICLLACLPKSAATRCFTGMALFEAFELGLMEFGYHLQHQPKADRLE